MKIERLATQLKDELGLPSESLRMVPVNEHVLSVNKKDIRKAVQFLLKKNVWHLTTITAVNQTEGLVLIYHFWMYGGLSIRVCIEAQSPVVDSIVELIPGARFYELEIAEMFGVRFIGLNSAEHLFLYEKWDEDSPMQDGKR